MNELATTTESAAFDLLQRQAKMLAASSLVPKEFQGSVANCGIAIEIAQRLGASPFLITQNIDVIHGRPSFRATFLIAMVNASGRFTALKFRVTGEGSDRACVAYCQEKATGEVLEGPEVSMAMAKAEGWSTKNGSKWLTMPDLMLRYRAAAFFARLYAPDITLGLQTAEEVEDIAPTERNVTPAKVPALFPALSVGDTADPLTPKRELETALRANLIRLDDALAFLRENAITEAQAWEELSEDDASQALIGVSHIIARLGGSK